MRLYIDFKSPAAWLAMKPTLSLMQRCDQTIEFLPFRTWQPAIPQPQASETVGERHRRVRAVARQQVHLKYADVQGVPMVWPQEFADTDLALAALLYVQDDPVKFIQAAFAAYWAESADLNRPDVVASLLHAQGYDASGFDGGRYLDALQQAQAEAEEAGVLDAPCYVVAEQMFIGREHLPWIEAILCGSDPRMPIKGQ